MKATIGYARVSTSEQSLDRQRDDLVGAGAEIVYEEVASGKKDADRPVWAECRRALRPGDTLMVTELSRLGRNTGQLAALVEELGEKKVGLWILNLGIDPTSVAGELVFTIIAAVSEMERELLIERTMSGLAAARARGRMGGRKRTITPAGVRKAQSLYDKGELSVTDIAGVVGVSRQTLYRYLVIGDKSAKSQSLGSSTAEGVEVT